MDSSSALFGPDQPVVHFAAGTVIFREADSADLMYVVLEGRVVIEIRGQVVEHVDQGGVFGEMALIEQMPRVGSATAITDVKLAAVNQERFLFLVRHRPDFALDLMTTIARRIRRMNAKI